MYAPRTKSESSFFFCLKKFSMLDWVSFGINAMKHMRAILPNLGLLLIWSKGLLRFSNTGGVMRSVRTCGICLTRNFGLKLKIPEGLWCPLVVL